METPDFRDDVSFWCKKYLHSMHVTRFRANVFCIANLFLHSLHVTLDSLDDALRCTALRGVALHCVVSYCVASHLIAVPPRTRIEKAYTYANIID